LASASFGSFQIRADGEDSAVDAGLRFAVKVRPVVERLKHEPPGDAADHFASLFAGGVETEVLQDDESVEGNQQASVLLRPTPVASRRLEGEKLGSEAFGCDARPLGCNRVGGFTGEVLHDLPTDGRVGIEEPFEMRGPECVIVYAHSYVIASGVSVFTRALNRVRFGSYLCVAEVGAKCLPGGLSAPGRRPTGRLALGLNADPVVHADRMRCLQPR
jgi:hypothetical protein